MSKAAVLIAVLSWFVCHNAWANSWYEDQNRGREGWYGYQEYEKPKPEKKQKEKQKVPKKPVAAWPSYEEALKMKPSELGRLLRRAREEAIGSPTEENILRWSSYMKAARIKSVQFASAVAWVNMTHPGLSNEKDYPLVTPGRRALFGAQKEEINTRLQDEAKRFALVLFVSDKAPLSTPAIQICSLFTRETGWKLKIVSVEQAATLAEAIGVSYVPQAWVIPREEGVRPFPAMTGVVSLVNLKDAVYRGLRVALGESGPEGFGSPVAPGTLTMTVQGGTVGRPNP